MKHLLLLLALALTTACTTPTADTYKTLPAHCAGSGRITQGTELYVDGERVDTTYEEVGRCDSWALCVDDLDGAYCKQ